MKTSFLTNLLITSALAFPVGQAFGGNDSQESSSKTTKCVQAREALYRSSARHAELAKKMREDSGLRTPQNSAALDRLLDRTAQWAQYINKNKCYLEFTK